METLTILSVVAWADIILSTIAAHWPTFIIALIAGIIAGKVVLGCLGK